MWFGLAIVSALLFGMAGLWMKVSQMKKGALDHLLLGLYSSGAIGFGIHAYAEGTLRLTDWQIWTAGIIIGAGSAWGNIIFMKALDYGPASLTSPLTNMNIVLIIFMSVWVYDEPLTKFGITGICLLLLAIILISIRNREPLTITEKKWFALVALAIVLFTFRNGGLKVTAAMDLENTPILFISYALSAVWFGIAVWRKSPQLSSFIWMTNPSAKVGLTWGLLTGLFSYSGLQLYSLALQIGPAHVVAPIFATNSLVMAFGSMLWFKEQLTSLQKIALLLLIIGLLLVRL